MQDDARSKLHLVSIVRDLVVAPCGRMPGEAGFDADGCGVDRSGLDDIGTFGGDLLRRFVAGTDDGDVSRLVVMVIVVAGDHEQAAIGGGLRLTRIGKLTPTAAGAFLG